MSQSANAASVGVEAGEKLLYKPVSPILLEMFRDGGWQYLLDPRGRAGESAVLCYDCTAGAATLLLAKMYRHVTVLHASQEALDEISRRVTSEGVTSASFRIARGAGDLKRLGRGAYSGLVVHDMESIVVRKGRPEGGHPALSELLDGARDLLEPGGFVYLGMRNRLSYSRIRGWPRNAVHRRSLTVGAATRILTASGYGYIAPHAFLLNGGYVSEMLPAQGYRAARGDFTLAEKLKRLALGRLGMRVFAAGYGLIAGADAACPPRSTLERLLNGHAEYGLPISAGPHKVKRYIVLNWGKVIVSVGAEDSKFGEYVLVLTREWQPILHRRRESRILKALAARGLSEAHRLPQFLGEVAVDGAACFVMRAIPGVSFDRHSPWQDELTLQAVQFIAALHAETLTRVGLDGPAYARLFGVLFSRARERNERVVPELDRMESAVRNAVMSTEIPVVWLHGDFKIENMIFDERTRRMNGVIDWEHSEEQGLPALDLLYLLTYNRTLNGGGDLLAALRDFVVTGPTDFEKHILRRYELAVPGGAYPPGVLNAMFFVHHVAVRYKYALDSDRVAEAVRDVLSLLTKPVAARISPELERVGSC